MPPEFKLRDYQERGIEGLRDAFRAKHRAALLVLPTGGGKTACGAEMILGADRKLGRTLWLVDRGELVEQASEAFDRAGVPHSLILPGERVDRFGRAYIGTVQSYLARHRAQKFVPENISLLVIDEAHRTETESYQQVLDLNPAARVVGLTATPIRGDGRGLGNTYGDMVCPVSIAELMAQGYLVPPRYFVPSEMDFSSVSRRRGEFSTADMEALEAGNPQLIGDIVETFTRLCPDRRAVAFPLTIKHSIGLRDAFNTAGIPACHIDGHMKRPERRALMSAFRSGEYQVLTSVNIAIEGLDVPDVSCVIMARPTKSQRIWIQCLDSETEILTPAGWARIGEIQEGQQVYGFDRLTQAIQSVPALATYRRPLGVEEKMVGVVAPHLDIRVTDGHRMVYKSRNKTSKFWNVKTAGELLGRKETFYIPVAGMQDVAPAPFSDAAMKFVGLFLSDGTLDGGTISIAQSLEQPQWMHDQIMQILDETGYGYRKVVIRRTGDHSHYAPVVHYKICKNKPKKGRVGTGWKEVEGFVTKAKGLTPVYESLSRDQVLCLMEGVWLGDGTKFQGKGWVKQTQTITFGAHHETAAALQSLLVRRGIRANLMIQERKPSAWNATPLPQAVLHYHPNKVKAIVGTASATNGSTPWQILPHVEGEEVWCVENELSTLITRRNGKVAIMGNCVGRGLRSFPAKSDCYVLDHAGVTLQFGPAEDHAPWELHRKPGQQKRGSALPEPRDPKEISCEQCKAVFFSERICPMCGHEHEFERAPREIEVVPGSLEELTREGRKKLEHSQEEKKIWWAGLQWHVNVKGWKAGAAYRMYVEKFGVGPGSWQSAVHAAPPSPEVLAWLRSRQIAYAKKKSKEQGATEHAHAAD